MGPTQGCFLFIPGIYTLFNGCGGTTLQTDPSDRTFVIANEFNDSDSCQQWEFTQVASGFVIRCILDASNGDPLYLMFRGGLRNGEPLRAGPTPMVWNVRQQDGCIRIMFSDQFCLDLDRHTERKVHLMKISLSEPCQLWFPGECESSLAAAPGPGAQMLVNVKAGTALEMSVLDRGSVACGLPHKARNQQWIFEPREEGYSILCSKRAFDGRPMYLTVEEPAKLHAKVVASPFPATWIVERNNADKTRDTFRLSWPNSDLTITAPEGHLPDLMHFDGADQSMIWRVSRP
ncbi:hypothetical protein OH77DRAFT_1425954 [Trametes cingulata]|nr:hypothetical protein OH77DRAFT_1425954 [Trametes cingulata]